MKKIFLALGLIFVFLVATNIQSIAQADKICACVNKNGKMRFTDSGKCKKKERLICWDAEGQQGPAGADGLMIEVHPRPDEALSDGLQSLKPEKFAKLIEELKAFATAAGKTL